MALMGICAHIFIRNNFSMSKDKSELSRELTDKIRYFIQDNSPTRISMSLRAVFFGYLRNAREGLPVNLDMVLDHMEALFELMDAAAKEEKVK